MPTGKKTNKKKAATKGSKTPSKAANKSKIIDRFAKKTKKDYRPKKWGVRKPDRNDILLNITIRKRGE
jgi:hypothetical protein